MPVVLTGATGFCWSAAGSESDKLWDGKHRKNGFCRHADSMTPNPFKMVCRYFLGINPGKMHCPRPWFGLCRLAAWQPKNGNNTASHRFREGKEIRITTLGRRTFFAPKGRHLPAQLRAFSCEAGNGLICSQAHSIQKAVAQLMLRHCP